LPGSPAIEAGRARPPGAAAAANTLCHRQLPTGEVVTAVEPLLFTTAQGDPVRRQRFIAAWVAALDRAGSSRICAPGPGCARATGGISYAPQRREQAAEAERGQSGTVHTTDANAVVVPAAEDCPEECIFIEVDDLNGSSSETVL